MQDSGNGFGSAGKFAREKKPKGESLYLAGRVPTGKPVFAWFLFSTLRKRIRLDGHLSGQGTRLARICYRANRAREDKMKRIKTKDSLRKQFFVRHDNRTWWTNGHVALDCSVFGHAIPRDAEIAYSVLRFGDGKTVYTPETGEYGTAPSLDRVVPAQKSAAITKTALTWNGSNAKGDIHIGNGFVTLFNPDYSALFDGREVTQKNDRNPAAIWAGEECIGVVMPIASDAAVLAMEEIAEALKVCESKTETA